MSQHTSSSHPHGPADVVGPGRVVVATDGTQAGLRGVRFAALEAERRGVGLELVHVIPGYLPTGPMPMVPDGSLQQFGHSVLEQSLTAAHDAAAGVATVSTLVTGGRVDSLVTTAEDAALLVLGSRPLSLSERVWTGATAAGVSARSTCPVVLVPAEYAPTNVRGRVVVGLKSPRHSAELLASAFALADELGAELVVLHAWKLQTGYDDIVANRVARDEWRTRETQVIEGLLTDLRRAHPRVPVEVTVVHGQAAHVLVAASRNADRLLISRPVHGGFFHHLGATARAVLREAHCPVEVHAPDRSELDGPVVLDVERAGALQR